MYDHNKKAWLRLLMRSKIHANEGSPVLLSPEDTKLNVYLGFYPRTFTF